jgi:hypothetical protein
MRLPYQNNYKESRADLTPLSMAIGFNLSAYDANILKWAGNFHNPLLTLDL